MSCFWHNRYGRPKTYQHSPLKLDAKPFSYKVLRRIKNKLCDINLPANARETTPLAFILLKGRFRWDARKQRREDALGVEHT
jgi:hypothetical protein